MPLLSKAGDLFADAAKALKNIKGGKGTPNRAIDDLPAGPKGPDTPNGGKGGGGDTTPSSTPPPPKGGDGSTTPSGAGDTPPPPKADPPPPPPKADPPPPRTDDVTSPAGNGPSGGAKDGGTPKGAPDSANNKPSPARDGAVGKDDLVCKSDPVDIARGNVVLAQVDLELPSPLLLERLHISSYRAGRWFGPQWTSTVDQRLEFDSEHVCYFSPDGMILVYPHPEPGASVLPLEGPRRPLTPSGDGSTYTLTDPARGTELSFGRLPGRGGAVLPLLAMVEPGGERVDVDYDALGAPRLLRHSAGYRVELETDAGRVTTIRVLDPDVDLAVVVRRFGYDERGRLTQVFNSSGAPELFSYDVDGRLTGWQDRNGTWYRYVYDADGRCVRTVGDRGFYDGEFAYDLERRVTTFTDSLGHATEFHLNEANQVVREVGPLGHTTVSTWDRYDRLLSRTDPLGRTTEYEHSADGLLAAVVRPDGSRALVASAEDGALTVTVTSGDQTWQRTYPAGTEPDLFTGQAGIATKFEQDRQWSAGVPQRPADDPVERDLFGRPRVVTDTVGGRTRLGWTVEGLRASRTGPSGRHEEWRHDAEGNVVEHAGVRYEYGAFDLPIAKIDATGARTSYEYDTELRLTRVTNPAGLNWSYTYDDAGRPVSETDFDGRVLRFTYDKAGQLVRAADGLGTVTTYVYDELGNVVERATATGTTTYAYDPVGFLVRATEADCVLEIERDSFGGVVRESVDGRAVTYTHDTAGIRRRTPSGVDSAWTFDDNGNPATLSVAGHMVAFRHDEAGREVERTIGEGAVLAQAFDAEHQLTGQTVTARAGNRVVQQRQYRYHVDGQLTGVDDAITGPLRYRLDAAGRVIGVATRDGEENYRYDPSGNISHAQTPPADPDAGPRGYTGNLLSAAGSVRYAHDRQGRLVARHETVPSGTRTWSYRWDAQDRLVGVRTPDGAEWRYRYDPLGRRVAKQHWVPNEASGPVMAEEVLFVWSGQLLVEQVQRGRDGQQLVLTWDHVPGSVRPVTQTEQLGTGVRFFSFLTDQVGTPVDMVDANGVVAWHASASLWGRAKPDRGGVSTPLRFPGQYADDETGLHYNVFRYYDPGTGRYLSQDPLGLAPAPNPVTYVPNPLRDTDPLGLGGCMSKQSGTVDDTLPPARPGGGGNAGHVQTANPPAQTTPTPNQPAFPPGDRAPTVPLDQWQKTKLPEGTNVYHVTSHENVEKILGPGKGIRPADDPGRPPGGGDGVNAWGGGELGNGFYTHKNPDSAGNYYTGDDMPATMEFKVKQDLDGKMSPEQGWIGDMRDDYRQGADYIQKHADPDEIKFHNGAEQLELSKISRWGMDFDNYDDYMEFIRDNS